MKATLKRDYELSLDGVTQTWRWECPAESCVSAVNHGSALYWSNALRGLQFHFRNWHRGS